ncbi:hypothetical protein JGY90_10045 [Staphylococcus xylosus]|uniref:hypothetical protein n=1 Tax=Staphylococcus xylosus TaxID=1288 RepID=UPI001CDBDB7B|nr:hypothetical protein [Staphylococcus xylosus]UBV34045.1 hypothetical protein JGY90_10045 [Staphylococcus xylosus]
MILRLISILKGLGIGCLISFITAIAVGRDLILGAIVMGIIASTGYYFSFLYERKKN